MRENARVSFSLVVTLLMAKHRYLLCFLGLLLVAGIGRAYLFFSGTDASAPVSSAGFRPLLPDLIFK